MLANGTAEQNVRSPATYLNTNFYGNVTVPALASPSASPQWVVVDRTGQFEWHDHRIHWMSPVLPPEVKNKSKRTLDLQLAGPDRSRDAQGGRRRAAVLDARELQGADRGDRARGADRRWPAWLFVLFVRRRRSRARGAATGDQPVAQRPGGSTGEAW